MSNLKQISIIKNHVILQLLYFRIQQTNVIYISNADVVEWMWVFPCWGYGSLIQFQLQNSSFTKQCHDSALLSESGESQSTSMARCQLWEIEMLGKCYGFPLNRNSRHTALLVLRKNRSPEISMHQNKQLIYTKYFL